MPIRLWADSGGWSAGWPAGLQMDSRCSITFVATSYPCMRVHAYRSWACMSCMHEMHAWYVCIHDMLNFVSCFQTCVLTKSVEFSRTDVSIPPIESSRRDLSIQRMGKVRILIWDGKSRFAINSRSIFRWKKRTSGTKVAKNWSPEFLLGGIEAAISPLEFWGVLGQQKQIF